MFKKLLKNKKAQNTAEYAILISLVVAGIIAMQTYAQRALQARVKDASKFMSDSTSVMGSSVQYEPYYLQSNYAIGRVDTDLKELDNAQIYGQRHLADTERTRGQDGYQTSLYNTQVGNGEDW
jgi:Flp pilus assembly pilin Flp